MVKLGKGDTHSTALIAPAAGVDSPPPHRVHADWLVNALNEVVGHSVHVAVASVSLYEPAAQGKQSTPFPEEKNPIGHAVNANALPVPVWLYPAIAVQVSDPVFTLSLCSGQLVQLFLAGS